MYGPSSTGQRKDPRPVANKSYMQKSIRALIAFMAQHRYEHGLTPEQLQSPTGRSFHAIVQFIFKQIDPNLKLDGKLDEEFTLVRAPPSPRPPAPPSPSRPRGRDPPPRPRPPQVYKRLCYPFMMSRSSLHAVGAPHMWPHLLAALTWLCELLVYEDRAAEARKPGAGDKDEGDNMNEVCRPPPPDPAAGPRHGRCPGCWRPRANPGPRGPSPARRCSSST